MISKNQIVNLAIHSLIEEASLYPKPGLVDPLDNGAHTDMDYPMFIESSLALKDGFEKYYDTGVNHTGTPKELFNKIRLVGQDNEANMFTQTNNINTHKGANFIYGIIISIIGYKKNPTLKDIQTMMQAMCEGLVEKELNQLTHYTTHGEKVYQKYGYSGIRGEVESGLNTLFTTSLPELYNTQSDYQTNLKVALIKLIQTNNDSNIIKRGSIEGLNYAKEEASKPYRNINEHLIQLNNKFKQRNLTPGGSADLLAITIFLYHYEQLL